MHHKRGRVLFVKDLWENTTLDLLHRGIVKPSCVHGYVVQDIDTYTDHVNEYWCGKRLLPQKLGPFTPATTIPKILNRLSENALRSDEDESVLLGVYNTVNVIDDSSMCLMSVTTCNQGLPSYIEQFAFVPPSARVIAYSLEIWIHKGCRLEYNWTVSSREPCYCKIQLKRTSTVSFSQPVRSSWRLRRLAILPMSR